MALGTVYLWWVGRVGSEGAMIHPRPVLAYQ